jgi:hypothetical protein
VHTLLQIVIEMADILHDLCKSNLLLFDHISAQPDAALPDTLLCFAAGDLKLVQFLLLNRCSYHEMNLARAAARSDSVELFDWLVVKQVICEHLQAILRSACATGILIAAVQGGHLRMCRHLLQLQEDSSVIAAQRVAYAAAKARNKQLLQWLLSDSGLTVSESGLFQYATTVQQDLATVLWLLEQGYALPADRYTGTQLYFKSSLRVCV